MAHSACDFTSVALKRVRLDHDSRFRVSDNERKEETLATIIVNVPKHYVN